MKCIPIDNARPSLSALCDDAERGEPATITRWGRAVAEVVPVGTWARTGGPYDGTPESAQRIAVAETGRARAVLLTRREDRPDYDPEIGAVRPKWLCVDHGVEATADLCPMCEGPPRLVRASCGPDGRPEPVMPSDLNERAGKALAGRWRAGMLLLWRQGAGTPWPNRIDGPEDVPDPTRYAQPYTGAHVAGVAIDSDPATRGAYLDVVREAWGRPHLYVGSVSMGGGRIGWSVMAGFDSTGERYDTEAEALVAALEAAPTR